VGRCLFCQRSDRTTSVLIFVSVTDDTGKAIDDLTIDNFRVEWLMGYPVLEMRGGENLGLLSPKQKGFYNIQVGPGATNLWAASLVAVIVSRKTNQPTASGGIYDSHNLQCPPWTDPRQNFNQSVR
jgi:hypothetical protein